MKKTLLVIVFVLLFQAQAMAQLKFPEPRGLVNDFAEILSEEAELEISTVIEEIKTGTSAELAVVTIPSLEGNDVNYYAVELGRAWGIGNKERDDGLLFLTAVEDRKTYIATGYGVEGYITDAQAFWISDQVVVPFFKEGDFDAGILAGVEQIRSALLELEQLPSSTAFDEKKSLTDIILSGYFWFFILLPWLAAVLGRSKRWWPGGIVGGFVGLDFVHQLPTFPFSYLFIIPFVLLGLFFDYLASSNYKKGKNRWWTGGGRGGWGGGSSGGFGGLQWRKFWGRGCWK